MKLLKVVMLMIAHVLEIRPNPFLHSSNNIDLQVVNILHYQKCGEFADTEVSAHSLLGSKSVHEGVGHLLAASIL